MQEHDHPEERGSKRNMYNIHKFVDYLLNSMQTNLDNHLGGSRQLKIEVADLAFAFCNRPMLKLLEKRNHALTNFKTAAQQGSCCKKMKNKNQWL